MARQVFLRLDGGRGSLSWCQCSRWVPPRSTMEERKRLFFFWLLLLAAQLSLSSAQVLRIGKRNSCLRAAAMLWPRFPVCVWVGALESSHLSQVHMLGVCVCHAITTPLHTLSFHMLLKLFISLKYLLCGCFSLLSGTSAVHVPHYVIVGLALVPSIIWEVALSVRLCQQRRVKDNPQQRTNPHPHWAHTVTSAWQIKKKDKNWRCSWIQVESSVWADDKNTHLC